MEGLASYYYILIETIICLIISISLLYYYARKNINPLVLFIAWITWFLNLTLIVLLTFDIYYTQTDKGKGDIPEITDNIIRYGYKIIYWSTFLLSWIFIPLIKSYEKSGEFTKIEKLKSSIKRNLRFYFILFVIDIVLFIYSLIKFGSKNTLILAKGGSLIFGIIFFFFLLSYSLIKNPKNLYNRLDYSKQIEYYEWKANKFFEKIEEIKYDLIESFFQLKSTIDNIDINEIDENNEDDDLIIRATSKNTSLSIEKQYKKNIKRKDSINNMDDELTVKSKAPKRIKDYLHDMKKMYNNFLEISKDVGIDLKKEKDEKTEPIVNVNDLILLNRRINKKKEDSFRMQYRIKNNYKNWMTFNTLEYLKNNKNNVVKVKEKEIDDIEEKKDIKKDEILTLEEQGFIPLQNFSTCKKFYYSHIRKIFIFIFFIISIIAVVITVFCEIFMMFKIEYVHGILGGINNIYLLHITILIPLLYFTLMSNYSLLKIKITSYIYMYGHKQTDSVSLMVFTSYLSRIYFAVCLNCMQCFNQFSEDEMTKFQIFFNKVQTKNEDDVILKLCRYSPCVLLLFILLFLFNIPGKIANCIGFNLFEFKSEERDLGIKKGHKYLMTLNKKLNGQLLEHHDPRVFEER